MRDLLGEVWLFVAMFIIAAAVFILAISQAPAPCDEYPCESRGQLL